MNKWQGEFGRKTIKIGYTTITEYSLTFTTEHFRDGENDWPVEILKAHREARLKKHYGYQF